MGEIVAAMATCHAPQLFTYPPDEDPAQLDASIAGMRELGKILDETRPDVIVFIGSDHLETFSIDCVPTFAILAGSRAMAEFAGRSYDLPVHREMAEDFLYKLVGADFDIAYSEDALLGHTFAVPFEFLIAERDIPVIPIHINVYMPPLPGPKRCAALGRKIAEIIASRPERVAIVASGGMSHYPGTWKYPHPEYDFDKWMIAELERGNTSALFDLTSEQLDEVGNTELLPWALMFGAIGDVPGELIQYTPTWHHGHAMMRFLPARPNAAKSESPPKYQFKNQGFEFYRHPPASAYKLNKMLFEVRTDSNMRLRLLNNLDEVAAEWGLNEQEKEATRAIAEVGKAKKISDNAAVLIAAGAHPLPVMGEIMSCLKERIAVVSGAAKGIGRAAAIRLAAEGAKIEILDVKNGAEVCEEIRAAGGVAYSSVCDVTNEAQIAEAVGGVERRHGRVDILVNNAGILSGRTPWHQLTYDEINRFVQINYIGYFLVSKAVYPLLKKSQRGRVINVASRTYFLANPGQMAYVAAKGAVMGFTRVLAKELGDDNITVNAVAPGMIATEGTMSHSNEEAFNRVMQNQAIKKRGKPEHLAALIAFLASDDAELITGQMILCDGGGYLH